MAILSNPAKAIRRIQMQSAAWELTFKILVSFLFAALTGILAQLQFPIGFSPVPITGQTFAVLLAGAMLGASWGMISQIMYVVLALVGVPWLAGFHTAAFASPTMGYLIGFVLATLVIGRGATKAATKSWYQLFLLLFAVDLALILGTGTLWLATWYQVQFGESSFHASMIQGFLPFIPGEALKAALVASTVHLFKR